MYFDQSYVSGSHGWLGSGLSWVGRQWTAFSGTVIGGTLIDVGTQVGGAYIGGWLSDELDIGGSGNSNDAPSHFDSNVPGGSGGQQQQEEDQDDTVIIQQPSSGIDPTMMAILGVGAVAIFALTSTRKR